MENQKQVEGVKPPESPQAPTPPPPLKKKRWWIWLIIVIIGGVAAWGFISAAMTNSAVSEVNAIYETSKGKWTPDDFDKEFSGVADFSNTMTTIKNNCETSLEELDKVKQYL